MNILATRVLSYSDEEGRAMDLVLTIFAPNKVDDSWKCGFTLPDPFQRKNTEFYGVDFLQAFLLCLEIVPSYLRLTPLPHRAHWQGMDHCGLPSRAKLPEDDQPPDIGATEENPGDMDILTTRKLAFPGENGGVREITLLLYSPFLTADGSWKCAFSFDPMDAGSIRYGTGADFIESCLDALAAARRVFESMIPAGWTKPDDLLDCVDFPIKHGRAFFRLSKS